VCIDSLLETLSVHLKTQRLINTLVIFLLGTHSILETCFDRLKDGIEIIVLKLVPRGTWVFAFPRESSASCLRQGECQWVSLEFPQPVKVSELKLLFQGGFSAKTCRLHGKAHTFSGCKTVWSSSEDEKWEVRCGKIRGMILLLVPSAGCPKDGALREISHFYPEDDNSLQISFCLAVQHFYRKALMEILFSK